jgi:hypothetical protein
VSTYPPLILDTAYHDGTSKGAERKIRVWAVGGQRSMSRGQRILLWVVAVAFLTWGLGRPFFRFIQSQRYQLPPWTWSDASLETPAYPLAVLLGIVAAYSAMRKS